MDPAPEATPGNAVASKNGEPSTPGVITPPLYLGSRYHPVLFGTLGLVAFVASIVFIFGFGFRPPARHKAMAGVVVALWSVGPPVWFFIEHFYYFPKYGTRRLVLRPSKTPKMSHRSCGPL